MPRERSNARPIGSPARTSIVFARTLALALLFAVVAKFEIRAAAPSEHEVKAAFVLNFARFVEWPADAFQSPTSPLIIGVVGANEMAEVLPRVVATQTAQGRPIEVRPLQPADDPTPCQVLFVGRSVGDAAEGILKSAQKRPVLTVGETDGFNTLGGIVRFLIIEKSVRFDVHAKAAADAGLKISSKLLAVARTVIKSP